MLLPVTTVVLYALCEMQETKHIRHAKGMMLEAWGMRKNFVVVRDIL